MSTAKKMKIISPLATILLVFLVSSFLLVMASPLRSYAFVVEGANCGLFVTVSDELVDVSNLNPGDTKVSFLLAENTGDGPLRYFFDLQKVDSLKGIYRGVPGESLDKALIITVASGGIELFHGLVVEFEELYMGVLQPGEVQQIDIIAHLAGPEVGNEYQGASVTVRFAFRGNCNGMGNCTATQGYWKTHSKYGSAHYNEAWAIVGEDTPFFLSGQSWYEVLESSSADGNAYYTLARQYIAAYLNQVKGATSTAEVDAAKAWSEEFFGNYSPTSQLNRSLRNQAIAYAEVLDQYNNGKVGPGSCDK